MKSGTRVEVRSRFDGSWSSGFTLESEDLDPEGRVLARRVKRVSDGMVLPDTFKPVDVRREAHRQRSLWWY